MLFYKLVFRSLALSVLLSALLSSQIYAQSNDQKFEQLLADHWSAYLKANPEVATGIGVRDYDEFLSDPSLQAYDAYVEQLSDFLNRAQAFNDSDLSKSNALNKSLFTLELETQINAAKHGGKYMIMTNRGGPHLSLTNLVGRLPFFTLTDYQSYLARLQAMPEYLSRATARLDAGLKAGWVQPCEPMQGFEASIQTHLVEDVEDSVFMGPFQNPSNKLAGIEFAQFRATAKEVIKDKVIPAFKAFETFYLENYAPACRTQVGTNSMPGGDDYYSHRVKRFTTTLPEEFSHKLSVFFTF